MQYKNMHFCFYSNIKNVLAHTKKKCTASIQHFTHDKNIYIHCIYTSVIVTAVPVEKGVKVFYIQNVEIFQVSGPIAVH